jgi:uncharacterized membrane protein YdfJ with MMPL/SSD domain
MKAFVDQVRSVDPEVTGNPLQIYEASQQMRRSYEHAAFYALVAILPVLAMTFGSLKPTLLAILPLVAGLLQTFGLMGILDLPLNSANMIGLSLMLGMGMENGILIVQDYLSQKGRYRMGASTGVAVVLNTLTTMVGFAVLMLAAHRGLQSLGRMLSLGMGCCLFSSVVMLPALLTWMTRNRTPEVEDDSSPPSDGSLDIGGGNEEYELSPTTTIYRRDNAHDPLGGWAKPAKKYPAPLMSKPSQSYPYWENHHDDEEDSTPMYGGA